MAELKPGWRLVKFGDVVRLNRDRCANPAEEGIERYVGLEHIDPEDLRIRRWGLVAEGTTFTNLFKPGQVLFGKRRAYQRKVAVADFEGVCSGDIYIFESKDAGVLLPDLLPFICQTDGFFDHAVGTSAGSLSPRTNWTQLSQYEFALPPLDEQRRIAKLLRCSQITAETLLVSVARLQQVRKAAIEELCWKHQQAQTVRLGDVCEMQNGRGFPGDQYQSTGIRLLRPGNLGTDGYLDWSDDRTVCLPEPFVHEAADYIISAGDILINLTAQSLEEGFMGRVCLARQGDRSLLNQRIGRFLFGKAGVEPEFVFRVMQTAAFQHHAISMCEGTKVKHLYWRHLERFSFPLPSQSRQREIAEYLRAIDESVVCALSRVERQSRLQHRLLNSVVATGVRN